MITDALLQFVANGSPLSVVGAANAGFPSAVIDLLGTGVGTAPQNIIGTRSVFGADMGIDFVKPQIEANIGTALATGSGGTLNMQFQGAIDQGSAGNYQPGTWNTFVETGAVAAANLGAGKQLRLDFAPAFPWGTLPRYLRVNFQTVNSFTAGTIANCLVTMIRDDYTAAYAGRNYAVA